jgi:hypothetical protein
VLDAEPVDELAELLARCSALSAENEQLWVELVRLSGENEGLRAKVAKLEGQLGEARAGGEASGGAVLPRGAEGEAAPVGSSFGGCAWQAWSPGADRGGRQGIRCAARCVV